MPKTAEPRVVPAPPRDLSEGSRADWPGLAADVIAASGGAEVDFRMLESILRVSDRLVEVRAILGREGLTTAGSKGQMRPHPLLDVEASLRREIAAGFEQLRLTPNRREYVRVSADGRLVSR